MSATTVGRRNCWRAPRRVRRPIRQVRQEAAGPTSRWATRRSRHLAQLLPHNRAGAAQWPSTKGVSKAMMIEMLLQTPMERFLEAMAHAA